MITSDQIDQHLGRALPESASPTLRKAMEYSLLSPGKRIRPRFVFASGKMLDLPESMLWPTALALEMYHCSTLIHDDLPCMDDDDYRRGRLSNHKVFGEAMALLAGDALLTLSFETFLQTLESVDSLDRNAFLNASRIFCRATGMQGVMAGQALEFSKDPQDLHQIHDLKTGELFFASITIPGQLARLPERDGEWQTLQEYARGIGRLFQVVDDILDQEQDQKAENVHTVLKSMTLAEAIQHAETEATRLNSLLQKQWGASSKDLQSLTTEIVSHVQKKKA